MKNGVLYVNTTPKGETEGLLAFVVPLCTLTSSSQWCAPRCQTPGSAKNVGTGTRVLLVAKDGG